jgi:integrase
VYRFQGKPRRLTLGTYPDKGVADAHIALASARKLLEKGVDPGKKEVERRKAERIAETVTELAEGYLAKWARPRKRSADEDERLLRKDVLPAWGRRKAHDIARKDVIALLDGIVDRGSPIAANRTLAVVRRMFGWALSRDIVLVNPCEAVRAPGKETRRDRVLSAEEIKSFWAGLDSPTLRMSPAIRLALKLQLATAQRKGEVISAEWSEFDIEAAKVWTIPPKKAKNGMAHRVPLSPLALGLLEEIKAAEAEKAKAKSKMMAGIEGRNGTAIKPSRWLFPSPRADNPITGPAVDHAMRAGRDALGVNHATPHDLRRSAASHMTSMGVSRLVVSKLLNHAEPGVTAVYDRHSYDSEKRDALEAWGRRLQEIVATTGTTSNVVK